MNNFLEIILGPIQIFYRTFINQRNHFILFLGLLIILFSILELSAQDYGSIIGYVFDRNNGNPLAGANVQVGKTGRQSSTDEDGIFILENIMVGEYEITMSFLGYREEVFKNIIVYSGLSTRINVPLQPYALPGDSIYVYANGTSVDETPIENKIILSADDIKSSEKFGLSYLLQQVAGVQVESAGGSGGVTYVTIHGSRPKEVLILLDGQRLNDPQTGEVDLNSIPITEIERIEIIRQGNSSVYGAGTFAGTIAFYTKNNLGNQYVRLISRFGSYKTSAGNLSVGSKIKSLTALGNYYQDYSLQNYPYNYENREIIRENNWFRNQRIFGKLKLDLNRYQLSFMYNMRSGNRGLPSTYFDENPSFNANLTEELRTLQFQYRWLFSHQVCLETNLSRNLLQQTYKNVEAPFKQQYYTRQKNEVLEGNVLLNMEQSDRFSSYLKMSYLKESLDQQNLLYLPGSIGQKNRESFAGFANIDLSIPQILLLLKSIQFRSSLGYQKIFNDIYGWYPFLGVNTHIAGIKFLSFGANWGKAVRYPDFNSLFWKGDTRAHGNPDLKPERKNSWNFSVNFYRSGMYIPRISMFYFTEKIYDLIFWHRNFNGEWEPRNEALVQKNGLDLQIEQNLFKEYLKLQTSYCRVNAVNKKEDPVLYNKKIIFIPEHTFNSILSGNYNNWQLQINFRYVSQRETVTSNSRGTQILPYQIWDVMLGYVIPIKKVNLDLGLIIKNILNEDYQLIFGYPMPGTEYQLTLAIEINP